VKSYVTSITNDASGSLASRRAVYGATYPFPPRYAERYMPASDGLSPYAFHSYRFGGPWVLMNQLSSLSPQELDVVADQIRRYKEQRMKITGGKVFHVSPPGPNATDAIQSYDEASRSGIAVVTRAGSNGSVYLFKPRGLDPETRYLVWFDIGTAVYSLSGEQLMNEGVWVQLPTTYSSDVVHIDPSVTIARGARRGGVLRFTH
jgi:alpha-galactosidase